MRTIRLIFLVLLAAVFGLAQISVTFPTSGQEQTVGEKPSEKTPTVRSSSFPSISLKDGFEPLTPAPLGEAADAVKLTSADFDSDGVADLVIADQNGALRFSKGNSAFLTNSLLEPFTAAVPTAKLSFEPDFFERGDFNGDGNQDILAARRGDRTLVFLAGLGNGQFAEPANIELGGPLTTLAVGEIGRADGQTDVAVAENSKKGSQLRVFEHPGGAFKHKPEIIALPAAAQFIATGFLGADSYSDIAVACGNRLVIVQGRGQVTPWDILRPKEIVRPKAPVATKVMSGNISGLAIGQFTNSSDLSLAILTSDGGVETLAPVAKEKTTNFADAAAPNVKNKTVGFVPSGIDAPKTFTTPDFAAAAASNFTPDADQIDPSLSPAEQRRIREEKFARDAEEFNKLSPDDRAAFIANGKAEAAANDEKSRENFLNTAAAVPVDFAKWEAKTIISDARLASANSFGLIKARVGFSGKDDLLVIDPVAKRINVIAETSDANGIASTQVFALESDTEPVAALPIRLNLDAKSDLVVLRKGSPQPTLVMSGATLNITVTSNLDGPSSCEDPQLPCTLRGAIIRANSNPGSQINFNIPSTPTIMPTSQLPVVRGNGTVINGLAVNVPSVEIDGTNAGFADGIKIRTSEVVVTGLAINSFKGIGDGNGSVVGGNGLTIESTELFPNNGNNWVFANYLGTDINGTTDKGNVVGLNIFDAHDNLIGSSDPTFRQVISGNGDPETIEAGLGVVTTNSIRSNFHGNLIGLNVSGAVALPNLSGVLLSGSNNVLGGDGVGEGNTISGNEKPVNNGFAVCFGNGVEVFLLQSVDENGFPADILTFGNRLQGNRIGIDVNGEFAIGNCRQGVVAPPYTATSIGSITERGRNTISGNGYGGIDCIDAPLIANSPGTNFGNCSISGNNVGTNVAGTVGIPNLLIHGVAGFGIVTNNGINVFHNRNFATVGFPLGFTMGDACTGFCNLVNGTIYRQSKFGDVGIFSNYMGVNKTGTASLSNYPTSYARYSGVIAGRGNTIVGDWAIAEEQPVSFGNLMSGSFCGGLILANSIANNAFGKLKAKANLIGTNAGGTFAIPNNIESTGCGEPGASINSVYADIEFGGVRPEEKNVIAGNNGNGLTIRNGGGELKIINTFIGVNRFEQPLGNTGNGISVEGGGPSHTIIGGIFENERNIIRSNGRAGIRALAIRDLSGDSVPRGLDLIGNSIANNGDLGIDLVRDVISLPIPVGGDGVNENDCLDADRGTNSLQNYPELIAPTFNGNGTVTVSGVLRTTPLEHYRIDYYANPSADGSNYGEGEYYLGSQNVVSDGNGFSSLAFTSTGTVPSTDRIVATATNDSGETSEFSCAAGVCTTATTVAELRDEGVLSCIEPDVVNVTTDESDADLNDGICDIDVSDSDRECSLRAAIEQGNASSATQSIVKFDIPGAGVKIIRPASALPTITKPFQILGETQPDYDGMPLIELRGDLTGSGDNGLNFSSAANDSRVSGLAINRFAASGILFNGNSGRVDACYLGLAADGVTFVADPLQGAGITMINSVGSKIGIGTGNVISGNTGGILITNGRDNRIGNNRIGTDKDGNFLLNKGQPWIATLIGIAIVDSPGNIIGYGKRNIISASGIAIDIAGATSTGNIVKSNYIGTNLAGDAAVNNRIGIIVQSNAASNVIGGPQTEANVIAGSQGVTRSAGIIIDGNAGVNNRILGNIVGLNATETASIPNQVGITVAASGTVVGEELAPDVYPYRSHLVVAGNLNGDVLVGNTSDVTVAGTLAGITRNGGIYNGSAGIGFVNVQNGRIFRNIVSGYSNGVGIAVLQNSSGNKIESNCVGCPTGPQTVSSRNSIGISISSASGNEIMRNKVVNSTTFGIAIGGAQSAGLKTDDLFPNKGPVSGPSDNNSVYANFIGTTDGFTSQPNSLGGIALIDNAHQNVIGGYSNDKMNVISGNTNVLSNEGYGVFIGLPPGSTSTSYPSGNIVIRNRIGVRETDNNALPNNFGIYIAKAQGNFIGTSNGQNGNVIANNAIDGIYVSGSQSTGNTIAGNTIFGNGRDGVFLDGAGSALTAKIGSAPQTVIKANKIGVSTFEGQNFPNSNSGAGIFVVDTANVLIGGDGPTDGNIIGANGGNGIDVSASSTGVEIRRNFIGTDETANTTLGNGQNGVLIFAATAVKLAGNTVARNSGNGVQISASASGNTVGGREENSGNFISGNGGAGVRIDETAGSSNLVDPNVITGNTGLGIDLNLPGRTPNDPNDADEGANRGQNFPDISSAVVDSNGDLLVSYRVDSDPANANYGVEGIYVEFFIADLSGEGRDFLGFNFYTVADHNAPLAGTKTVNLGNAAALGFATGDRVTSTATDADNNTSEFTPVFVPTAANVSIAGRVSSSNGQPLGNVIIALTAADGTTIVKRTNTFGRYQFEGLESGSIYTVTATSRKHQFESPTRVINLSDDVIDADFIASSQ